AGPGPAGERLADPPQDGLASWVEVGEAHRVAIHGRVVVAGHGQRRDDLLGEDPTEGVAHVHPLDGRHRGKIARDELARLRHRHRVRIVIVGAGSFAQRLWRHAVQLLASSSSAKVLMLRNASAWSSKAT